MHIYKISSKNNKENNECIYDAFVEYINKVDKEWNYITSNKLKGNEGKYFLLDIRDEDTFKEGHIKGSKNIFWKELLEEENIKKLPKNKTILLICYVGHTASQMMVALNLLGYKAKVLKFGMGKSPVKGVPVAGWLDYGYDIIKGS